MFIVCLTGGIGSGKSSVTAIMQRNDAVGILDADVVAREVVSAGKPGLDALVAEFGDGILMTSGSLDRKKLASLVFRDTQKLSVLNAKLHPLIQDRLMKRLDLWERESRYDLAVLVIPLLVESGKDRYPCRKIIVVDADEDVVFKRLIENRGMTEQEVRDRIASQVQRDERLALADYVIPNSGSFLELESEIVKVWQWLMPYLEGSSKD